MIRTVALGKLALADVALGKYAHVSDLGEIARAVREIVAVVRALVDTSSGSQEETTRHHSNAQRAGRLSGGTGYAVVQRLATGVVVLSSPYGHQVFSMVKIRKARACSACGQALVRLALAFRPLTNGNNRTHRICVRCVNGEA